MTDAATSEATVTIEKAPAKHIKRKKSYIKNAMIEALYQALDNMSENTIEQTFQTIINSDESPQVLNKLLIEILSSHSQQARAAKPNYQPVEDYEATYSTGEVANLLRCQVNTVKNRIKNLKLIGYRFHDKDDYKLPQWQFAHGDAVAGIDKVLQQLNKNGIPAFQKFILPMADYDNQCIIDVLRENHLELALEMAAALK